MSLLLDEKHGDMSADDRNDLSVAFKNLISEKRSVLRTISSFE